MGTAQNSSARIIEAAISAVRETGLENLTTRQIAKLAETSPGNMYTFFSSKEELLEQCFYKVEREIAALFGHISPSSDEMLRDPAEAVRRLWYTYFGYLLQSPDRAVFYFRFRTSAAFPAFRQRRDRSFFDDLTPLLMRLDERYRIFAQMDADLLWMYVLDTTLMYANRIIEGSLPDTPATANSIYRLLMRGFQQFFEEP
jgi:Transcriptional regulator